MENSNLVLKYNILKARIAQLIEEHTEALALAQYYAEKFNKLQEEMKNYVEKEEMVTPEN